MVRHEVLSGTSGMLYEGLVDHVGSSVGALYHLPVYHGGATVGVSRNPEGSSHMGANMNPVGSSRGIQCKPVDHSTVSQGQKS